MNERIKVTEKDRVICYKRSSDYERREVTPLSLNPNLTQSVEIYQGTTGFHFRFEEWYCTFRRLRELSKIKISE